jgi:hypothetical protein
MISKNTANCEARGAGLGLLIFDRLGMDGSVQNGRDGKLVRLRRCPLSGLSGMSIMEEKPLRTRFCARLRQCAAGYFSGHILELIKSGLGFLEAMEVDHQQGAIAALQPYCGRRDRDPRDFSARGGA